MPSVQEEFAAACSTKVDIDSETVDLAQQVLERCQNAILETSTFGYGQPAQVHSRIKHREIAHQVIEHEALAFVSLAAAAKAESFVYTGRGCQEALFCVCLVYSQRYVRPQHRPWDGTKAL